MNILLITNRYPKDASDPAAPFVPDFVRALEALGLCVIVSTPLYGPPPEEEECGVHRFRLGSTGGGTPIGSWNMLAPRTWWRIHRFVREGKKGVDDLMQRFAIDHILALWALPSGWFARCAARKWGVPYSVWCLGSDINNWARQPLFGWLTKEVLRDAEEVFADGFALAKAAGQLSGRRCRFLASFRRLVDDPRSCPENRGDRQYFLYAGRIHRDKGVFDLLAAFDQAGSELDGFELVFVGEGPELPKLTSMAAAPEFSGRVRILVGVPTATLAGYYRSARATVIPSYADSLPLVFSEAVQCGSPVVVYDTGDLGHFVRRFKLGRVVAPGDVGSLSRALVDAAHGSAVNPAGRKAALKLLDPARAARIFCRATLQVGKRRIFSLSEVGFAP